MNPIEHEVPNIEDPLYESQMEDLTLEKLKKLAPKWKTGLPHTKKYPKKRKKKDKKYLVYREDRNMEPAPTPQEKSTNYSIVYNCK